MANRAFGFKAFGFMIILTFCVISLAFGAQKTEVEEGIQEIIDVLKLGIQKLEDGEYGAAASDIDYGQQRYNELKGVLLGGCIRNKFEGWVAEGEPSIENLGANVLVGSSSIEQPFDQKGVKAIAKISMSPVVSGLAALFNPALMGKGKGKTKRFPDGTTVQIQEGKISGKVGQAIIEWSARKNQKTKVAPPVLLAFAKNSVDLKCVKELVPVQ